MQSDSTISPISYGRLPRLWEYLRLNTEGKAKPLNRWHFGYRLSSTRLTLVSNSIRHTFLHGNSLLISDTEQSCHSHFCKYLLTASSISSPPMPLSFPSTLDFLPFLYGYYPYCRTINNRAEHKHILHFPANRFASIPKMLPSLFILSLQVIGAVSNKSYFCGKSDNVMTEKRWPLKWN